MRLSAVAGRHFLAGLLMACACGCAGFRALRKDIDFMKQTSIISTWIENADQFTPAYGVVVEWDRDRGRVLSIDATFEFDGAGQLSHGGLGGVEVLLP